MIVINDGSFITNYFEIFTSKNVISSNHHYYPLVLSITNNRPLSTTRQEKDSFNRANKVAKILLFCERNCWTSHIDYVFLVLFVSFMFIIILEEIVPQDCKRQVIPPRKIKLLLWSSQVIQLALALQEPENWKSSSPLDHWVTGSQSYLYEDLNQMTQVTSHSL